jgi:hypothetical protein
LARTKNLFLFPPHRPTGFVKLFFQSDAAKVIPVLKALLESNTAEALLDAFLAILKPTPFTPKFLLLLQKYNR